MYKHIDREIPSVLRCIPISVIAKYEKNMCALVGEGNGNLLQYSCLKYPVDGRV